MQQSPILLAVALSLVAPLTRAQITEKPPEPDVSRPYQPPPAWKSVEIANYYLKRKKYNAALSRYQEAVRTDPYYPDGYLGLGKVYEKIGMRQKALGAYRKYLDLLPSEKQAEQAKGAHQAIARLERELKVTSESSQGHTSAAGAADRQR